MQNFPLIFEHQKFPRRMKKSNMFDATKFNVHFCSYESTTFRCYSFYIVALMNVDFSELYYSYKLDFLLNIIIVKRLSSKHYSKYHKYH